MNRPIVHLYALLLILLGLVVWKTSQWAVFDADELRAKADNRRPLIEEQQIPRGRILSADGVLLAESLPQGGGDRPVYVRRYPQGAAFGHPIGYSFVEVGRAGVERSENGILSGEENEFASIVDELRGLPPEGSDLTLTIDAAAQRIAIQGLEQAIAANSGAFPNAGGSAVAIEPATGAVRVLASVPGFDPNVVQNEEEFARLNQDPRAPVFNRATQATGYPPGSTMKVVTAAAALDSGEIDETTAIESPSPLDIGGFPLENFGNQSFGAIDPTTALTQSVNTFWAQVGERLGSETFIEYMERFGFNADPELDYPDDQMAASGVAFDGGLAEPGDPVDIGRVAIGQGGVSATPLQMAAVAATVANGGTLMEPTFVQQVTDPDGRVTEELDPSEQEDVISDEAAQTLTEMMTAVTREGTAAGLTVPGATDFAGKTGTAEIDVEASVNQPWFIGFAPAEDPQIAVAVTIERCTGCTGGEAAGPVATRIMGALLGG